MKYLYTPTVQRRGRIQLLDVAEVQGRQGFASVYGFPPETAEVILAQKHLRDIRHMPVFADVLLTDFDNEWEAAERFRLWLVEQDYTHKCYTSGNRSIHIHVATTAATGSWVPRAHKEWVKVHAPGSDLTIYRQTGLFRLEGTWHEKNPGHRKQLTSEHYGGILDIPYVPPLPKLPPRTPDEAQRRLQYAVEVEKTEGNRRLYVWYLGTLCAEAGMTEDEAREVVYGWAASKCSPPLPTEHIERKLAEAYR